MSFDREWLRQSTIEEQVQLEATWLYLIDEKRRQIVTTRIRQGLIPILEIDGGFEFRWLGRLNRIHGRGQSQQGLLEAFDLSVENIEFRLGRSGEERPREP